MVRPMYIKAWSTYFIKHALLYASHMVLHTKNTIFMSTITTTIPIIVAAKQSFELVLIFPDLITIGSFTGREVAIGSILRISGTLLIQQLNRVIKLLVARSTYIYV